MLAMRDWTALSAETLDMPGHGSPPEPFVKQLCALAPGIPF
jgi:hypothetical protein